MVVLELGAVGHEVVGVYEHLQVVVLPQVQVGILVDGLRLVLAEVLHDKAECLFVLLGELWLVGVADAGDAWWQDVSHGLALGVLLHVDSTHLQHTRLCAGACLQALLVLSPSAAHEVERTEAQHDVLFEAGEEHTHETDGGEVVDAAVLRVILGKRYAVLVPTHGARVTVAQLGVVVAVVNDVRLVALLSPIVVLELLVADRYAILIVTLILVERVVLIDILHVGAGLVGGVVGLCLVIAGRRVALRVVNALVAVHDALLLGIEVRASVIVVVIAGGVIAPCFEDAVVGGNDAAYLVEPVGIGLKGLLFLVGQSVESHVLQLARTAGGGEGVSLRGLAWNLSPLCGLKTAGTVDGHAALVELLAVAQHVLGDFSQVDVEFAAVTACGSVFAGVDKGVEHPELHIFYIGLLEVSGLQTAHHASPLRCGVL